MPVAVEAPGESHFWNGILTFSTVLIHHISADHREILIARQIDVSGQHVVSGQIVVDRSQLLGGTDLDGISACFRLRLRRFALALADILVHEQLDAVLKHAVLITVQRTAGQPVGVLTLRIVGHVIQRLAVAELDVLGLSQSVVGEGKVGEYSGIRVLRFVDMEVILHLLAEVGDGHVIHVSVGMAEQLVTLSIHTGDLISRDGELGNAVLEVAIEQYGLGVRAVGVHSF